jgi:hypothetical protein
MPTTNPFDRKMTAVLKSLSKGIKGVPAREKVGKDFHAVRSRVMDATLGPIFDDLFKSFSAPADQRVKPDQAQAVTVIRALCDRQFVSSAAFLFACWRDLVASQPFDAVLQLAPDAASFEVWRKASARPLKEIIEQLLVAPATNYATAGADWLLLRVPPEKQIKLLDFFLMRQPRPKYLPTWAEALALALQKDKRGALLRVVLGHPWSDENRIVNLAEVIRGNVALMKAVIDVLPQILTSKEPPPGAVALVRQLFANLITTTDTERQFASASLARLGTGILLQNATNNSATEVLRFIHQAASQLRGATRVAEVQSQTWVLENLRQEDKPADGTICLNLNGARHIAVGFEKARQGLNANAVLSMTAKNLGMSAIGAKGEQVVYNPLQHEDTHGGIMPGETVEITEPGWTFRNSVVLRALVVRAVGTSSPNSP